MTEDLSSVAILPVDETPSTVADLIDRWETIGAFAADAGCGYEAARKMRSRGSIAPGNWDGVIAAAEGKGIPGINYEWLVKSRSAKSA
ncbi:hypothetical protein [Rhizobium sp. SSA_523]|uniref:hypothetical protein n=1 Tax=Rhizobium sp. SSA_523 TaxID=2952477 RepID=UPI002090A635|nr:hypothetical protein [Rhizobium sp. SSA_523]MCO5730136.1 hypothetical protein [Rhizobium sp. SSA_523]WKC25200.1 hypothetical protein QTJ18_14535 [Rhizobium sp. SSA_523]